MTDQTYCEAPDCEGARERGVSGRALAVCVKGFSFAYPEGEQILDELDFSVEEGAFALLVGATGSGKTTLLRSLKPEVAPVGERSGELRVFGEDLAGLSTEQSASLIGFVSQNPANQIVCDRVWHELAFGLENLGVPRSVMHRRIAETSHFFGIEPLMDRATTELSGGQQQLVNLAAVLSLRPKVLLLDEPTGFLDPVTEKSFLHALFRVNRELGITVVVSTHSPESMVDYATVCFEMKQGKIENVSHDRFKARDAMSEDVARLRRELRAGAEEKRAFGPTVVDVHDVRFRYHRDMPDVLRGCDFSVAAGSVHALVGGNGSGKSTLLSLIAGIRKPGRGRVRSDLASKQVLLPQDPKALFVCDTVAEELAEWGPRCGYGEEEIARAVERFNLAGLERRHPYDLSGGQQQRLAWAKALLTNPELVLMDEPTKGLDAPSRLAAAQSLLELVGEGRTVVMVTHDLMFTALVADSVSMLFDGEIACTEPAQEFFDGNVFYRPALDSLARIIEEESAC